MNASQRFQTVCAALLVGAGFLCSAAPALDIVKDGRPRALIVVADDAGRWQKWAAGWLQSYVRRASGAVLPIVAEREKPSGVIISVGRTKLSQRAGIRTDNLQWDGCRLIVRGRVLYLIGRDVEPLKSCT